MHPSVPTSNPIAAPHSSRPHGANLLNRAIAGDDRMVVKRDGSKVRFDLNKVTRAIALAFHEVRTDSAANPYRDDILACFGLDSGTFLEVTKIAAAVSQMLELYYRNGRHPTIEQIQDAVEKAIAAGGHWEVARSYMLYRARHSERRLVHYADNGMSDYIAMAKYARYRPELRRREIFTEGVERVRDMHLQFFAASSAAWLPVSCRRTSRSWPAAAGNCWPVPWGGAEPRWHHHARPSRRWRRRRCCRACGRCSSGARRS
jgi:ribonucleoside-triphosphate reductase